jgi:hypothetical protein
MRMMFASISQMNQRFTAGCGQEVLDTAVYFVMSVLTNLEMSIGVGFGLFGLFSLLRYRTNTMPAREMTYLFIVIALPVMNSILITNEAWPALLLANLAIVGVLFILEREWGFHYELSQRLTYERIELIKPENYDLLLADLRDRTGLHIKRCEVGRINFLRDTAEIKIYYDDPQRSGSLLETALVKAQNNGYFSRETADTTRY